MHSQDRQEKQNVKKVLKKRKNELLCEISDIPEPVVECFELSDIKVGSAQFQFKTENTSLNFLLPYLLFYFIM